MAGFSQGSGQSTTISSALREESSILPERQNYSARRMARPGRIDGPDNRCKLSNSEPDQPDFTHVNRKVKVVIRAVGLRDELSFTSFRHGGFTEGGDAELTDREMLAQGRHMTVKVLSKYTKRTDTADRQRCQEAPGSSNKRRTFVRMSISLPVRTES
jgi:hypothetical protein